MITETNVNTSEKNKALKLLADNLKKHSLDIIKENKKDLFISKKLGDAFLDEHLDEIEKAKKEGIAFAGKILEKS